MTISIFDANFYRSLYPDLAQAGLTTNEQLRQHFLTFGINEGRQFSKFVELNYYTASYPDLKKAGLTTKRQLFDHLEQFGATEGRRAAVTYNPIYYKAVNPDLVQANLNNEQLLEHYQKFGINEGRAASEFFNPRFYLDSYPDLKAAFGNNYQKALEHFLTKGIAEGRFGYGISDGGFGSGYLSLPFDPGNTVKGAYELGSLVAKARLSNVFNTSNQEDYYYFNLDKPSNFNLWLISELSTTVKLFADINNNQKIDPGEQLLTQTSTGGYHITPTIGIDRVLPQGGYYLDIVTGSSTFNNNYYMEISASPKAGNTVATALDIGNLSGSTYTHEDLADTADRDAFYRFVLTNPINNFNLSVFGAGNDSLTANLYADANNNGQIDPGELLASGSTNEYIHAEIASSLGAGTYFVDIVFNSVNSGYLARLTAT
ncbi:MAG TPA: hypothetical protein V6D28_24365 [Leptolyngbyaceae cyanobacterium]